MTTLKEMEKMVEGLPFGRCINVSKNVTYDIIRIVEHLIEEGLAVTAENVLGRVETYAKDDFLCEEKEHLRFLVFTDENGEEIL